LVHGFSPASTGKLDGETVLFDGAFAAAFLGAVVVAVWVTALPDTACFAGADLFVATFFAGRDAVEAGAAAAAFAGAFFALAFFATGAAFVAGGFLATADAFFAGAFLTGAAFVAGAFLATGAAFFADALVAGDLMAGAFFAAGAAFFAAGAAFFAGDFVAEAFFTGVVVFAAAFLAVPAPLAAGDRRATTLRAAVAALPARDRVVLRAMGNLPGTRAQTREGCGRRSGAGTVDGGGYIRRRAHSKQARLAG
jgi:hypothetical protein